LWTLLEACLDTGNLTRAQSILIGLGEVATMQDLTLATNLFLNRLSDFNNDYRPIQEAIRSLEKRIPQFSPNAVTFAILLKSIHRSGDTEQLKAFVGKHMNQIKEILSKIEVLGLAVIKDIVEVSCRCFLRCWHLFNLIAGSNDRNVNYQLAMFLKTCE
jgi:DNA-directed RNA polymerase